MTPADRLAEAVDRGLGRIEDELAHLYCELDIGWDDDVEATMNEIRDALTAYRSAPVVDIEACARAVHGAWPDSPLSFDRARDD